MPFRPTRVRLLVTCLLVGGLLGLVPSAAVAAPVLLQFDVTFNDGDPAFPDPLVDAGVVVGGGLEVAPTLDPDRVGSVFFDDEFVDVASTASLTTLQYQIQGGGDPHSLNGDYSLTGWSSGTSLVFSNFVLSEAGTLTGVGVSANKVIGAGGGAPALGADFSFTNNSLTILLADLGILEQAGQLPLGLLTFSLTFEASGTPEPPEPPNPVPEPGSLALAGLGAAAVIVNGARRRRA